LFLLSDLGRSLTAHAILASALLVCPALEAIHGVTEPSLDFDIGLAASLLLLGVFDG